MIEHKFTTGWAILAKVGKEWNVCRWTHDPVQFDIYPTEEDAKVGFKKHGMQGNISNYSDSFRIVPVTMGFYLLPEVCPTCQKET